MRSFGILFLLMFLSTPAFAQPERESVTPLFASDDTITITLDGPIQRIGRMAVTSTDAYPASLSMGEEVHQITLSARGKSRRRRDVCRFPPLRVAFDVKPAETSLFHRQKRLKLVTHCRGSDAAEQDMLREYTAYRLFNVLTEKSLRVRLARITYTDRDKVIAQKLGFFIEDGDDAAERLGLVEVDTGNIASGWLEKKDAARYLLFQYMIGNTDWSMVLGPEGDDCCHNSRLFGESKEARRSLIPVPYDFDQAGLVDAPYAVPDSSLRITSVKRRVYRGFCTMNEAVIDEAPEFMSRREALIAEIAGLADMTDKTRTTLIQYLAGFFEDIADRETIERKMLSRCR